MGQALLVCDDAQHLELGVPGSVPVAVVRVGGCALDRLQRRPGYALRIAYLIDSPTHLAIERASLKPHTNHLQNITWVRSQRVAVTLEVEGEKKLACATSNWPSASMAVCQDVPRAIELSHTHFRLYFALRTVDAEGTRAGTRAMKLVPSALVENAAERAAVWTGAPLFVRPGWTISWPLVHSRSEAWRAAGFDDVHLLTRTPELCEQVRRHTPQTGCAVRQSFDDEAVARSEGFYDHRLYNMLGLACTQAAGYAAVAFWDLDETPGSFGDIGSGVELALRSLRASDTAWPYVRAFRLSHLCRGDGDTGDGRTNAYCPASRDALLRAVSEGRCPSSLGGAARPGKLTANPFKILGKPARLAAVGIHDAVMSPGVDAPPPGVYNACITSGLRVVVPSDNIAERRANRAPRRKTIFQGWL